VVSEAARTLDIELDFPDEGQGYEATFHEDTEETHCLANPEAYQVRKGSVEKGDIIHAELTPGGAHCMWIRPKENKDHFEQ
jgi:alpha-glucosidase